jgi:hypothetical protein
LERRERAVQALPEPLEFPNWERVVDAALASRDEVASGNSTDSDVPHYIYEAVMVAVFGKDYFTWHNRQIR